MTIQFNDETFRGDYTFKNSGWALKRFPFPFHEDSYMYSVNMEQHKGGPAGSIYEKRFDVDEHYLSEMRDRAEVLKECWANEMLSPDYHKIQPHLGFIFNFHCADYKSKYFSRVVSWSRIHKGQRFERLRETELPAAMKYLKDINRLKFSLLFGKKTVTLVDGSVVSVPNFSKFERIKLIFDIFTQKIRYSRFVIKPISRIYKSFLRRLNLYKGN